MSLFSLLLQADSAGLVPAPPPTTESLSVFALLKEGGVLMIPLLLCSLVMVYVFAERWMAIRKATHHDPNFLNRVREHIMNGNFSAAKSICRANPSPEARMVEKGLSRLGKPVDHIEKSMENTGVLELYKLEKNVNMLSTLASIAPMFGFLGTIFGMIQLFFNIQHAGFSIENIAGGIYTKMVTSAVGLIIGLLSYMAYRFLTARLNNIANRMDSVKADFLDIILEPAAV